MSACEMFLYRSMTERINCINMSRNNSKYSQWHSFWYNRVYRFIFS